MNTTDIEQNNPKLLSNPPGGLLIWIVIYLELLTYGLAFFSLAYYGSIEKDLFHKHSQLLDKPIAVVNTIILLTSGFLIAKGVHFFKYKQNQKSGRYFTLAMLFGLTFLVLKMIEYKGKINAGLDMDYSTFFMFYWLMTGFHWVHVFVGIIISFFVRKMIVKNDSNADVLDVEAGAAFWHLCDLIWLILFPMLYLLF